MHTEPINYLKNKYLLITLDNDKNNKLYNTMYAIFFFIDDRWGVERFFPVYLLRFLLYRVGYI